MLYEGQVLVVFLISVFVQYLLHRRCSGYMCAKCMSGNSIFIISLILSPPVKTSQLSKYLSANCVISYLTGTLEWQRPSLVAQTVKNPSAMRENWVQSLGWKYPLEEGVTTHSSILAWWIPMDRGAWRAMAHRVSKSWTWLKQLSTAQQTNKGEENGERNNDSNISEEWQ